MKIAFISLMEGFPWGGSEELWSLAAMKALDKGQSVFFSVKLWDKQPERIKNLIENGAKPFFRHENERSVSLSSRIWTRIFPKKNSVEWSWIADHKIDHVCISMGGNYDIVYHERLANFLVENNVSYSLLQQFNFENEVLSRNIREKAKLLFENAKRVFFVSARNLMVSQRNLVTVLSNSFIINNPLRFSITAPLAYPSKEYGLQIAIVARLDAKYKGQDVALTALSTKIWKERSWVLNLYGSGPDEDVSVNEGRTVLFVSHNMPSIRNLCNDALLLSNGVVEFRGGVENVVNYYINNSSNFDASQFVIFDDTFRLYKHNRYIEFTEISLLDTKYNNQYAVSDVINFALILKGNRRVKGARIAMGISSFDETTIGVYFGEENIDIEEGQLKKIVFSLKNHQLAKGQYYFDFSVGVGNEITGFQDFDHITKALFFEISFKDSLHKEMVAIWDSNWGKISFQHVTVHEETL